MARSCNDCIHDKLCDKVAIDIGIPFVNPDTFEDYMNKADVVEVVRCGDCKHCQEVHDEWDNDWYFCLNSANDKLVEATDFCSYGERSDT